MQKTETDRYNLVLWVGNEPSLFQHECIEILSIANVSVLFSEHLLSGKVKIFKKPNKNQLKKSLHTQPSPVYISEWSTNTRTIFSRASSSSGLKQKCRDTTKRKVKSNCCEFNLLMFIFFQGAKGLVDFYNFGSDFWVFLRVRARFCLEGCLGKRRKSQ